MTGEPFTLDVDPGVLADLRDRLHRTRWAPPGPGRPWRRGTAEQPLRRLVEFWADEHDWPAAQERLNRLDHRLLDVDGQRLHHVRAGTRGAPPLLLVHGWPDSFLRFERLLPLLADDADLVVPSLPGFGFSGAPTRPGCGPARIADLLAELMTALGHDRFLAHGGDWGSAVVEQLARRHPDRLLGLHLTDIPMGLARTLDPSEVSEAERDVVARGRRWASQEGAYHHQQSTRPQTLAYALHDSPAGLASWFLEKWHAWTDHGGRTDVDAVLDVVGLDVIADGLTLYWATGTVGSASQIYFEARIEQQALGAAGSGRIEVPTAVAIFPRDLVPAPRVFGERFFDVRRWTEMPRGGHFAALEEPELLAEDLRATLADFAG